MLYVSTRLRKVRLSVGFHHLPWRLPVVLYAVGDGVNLTELVLFPVPLGSGVVMPPGESAAGIRLCVIASSEAWCQGLRNLAEVERERLEGDFPAVKKMAASTMPEDSHLLYRRI